MMVFRFLGIWIHRDLTMLYAFCLSGKASGLLHGVYICGGHNNSWSAPEHNTFSKQNTIAESGVIHIANKLGELIIPSLVGLTVHVQDLAAIV